MSTKIRRILLIHADDAVKEMLLLCLETIPNSQIIAIDSGIEAITKAAEVDFILLDMDEAMPDLRWQEIFQNLKRNSLTYPIPIILLTATPQSQELIELQKTESVRAIAKSFDLLNLANDISNLLDEV
ncbi:MAG: response regulator [Cyanobacteria bacterium J06607_15]